MSMSDYYNMQFQYRSQSSIVGVVTRLQTAGSCSNPSRGKGLVSSQNVRISSGAHAASYSLGTGALSLR